MEKRTLIVLNILVLIILMTNVINAEGLQEKEVSYAGIVYSRYFDDDISDLNFFVGIRKWKEDYKGNRYAFGGELEVLDYSRDYIMNYLYLDENDNVLDKQSYDTTDDYEAKGFLASFTYEFRDSVRFNALSVYSAIGAYYVTVNTEVEKDNDIVFERESDWKLGGKIGLELNKEINDNLGLRGRLGYRVVDNFEGLELACLLSIDL